MATKSIYKLFSLFLIIVFLNTKGVALADSPLNIKNLNKKITLSSFLKPIAPGKISANSLSYTFSGATDNNIDYIQICNATDNTCAQCSSPLTIIGGTVLPYTTTGTSYSINKDVINDYLAAGGFAASTYYIGMFVKSQSLVCNGNTQYCTANQDNASHRLCIQATYNPASPATTDLTRIDNGIVPLTTPKSLYAYVADTNANLLYQCIVSANGEFGASCAAPLLTPTGRLSLGTTTQGSQKLYIASIGTQDVQTCNVNAASGAVSACAATTVLPGGSSFGIVTQSAAGAPSIYVTDGLANNGIYRCNLNAAGVIQLPCTATGSAPTVWSGISDIIFSLTTTDSSYAYATDTNGQFVAKCPFNASSGSLGACTVTPTAGAPPWFPGSAIVTPVDTASITTWFSYVTDANTSNVYRCNYNIATGEITPASCIITPGLAPWSNNIINITTWVINGVTYAYINDLTNNQIYKCEIDGTGSLIGCAALTANPWTDPFDLIFAYF
jgi:hypothetical protein